MSRKLNVGLMGLGFIGRVHVNAYHAIPLCFPSAAVAANMSALLRSQAGSDEFLQTALFNTVTTSTEDFFKAPLDLVDICTPNHLHEQEALAAIERGIPVYCEKPLTRSLSEARRITGAAEKKGVLTHTAFVLRYLPAIRQIKTLVDSGELGEIFNFRAHMFHSSYLDRNRPMSWRLRMADSGGGAFADLGAHLVDLVCYLLGGVSAVRAQARTWIKERPVTKGSSHLEKVDVDDWMQCTLELQRGAIGLIEVTRMAAGAGEETTLEVFGSKGAVAFSVAQLDAVRYFDTRRGQWLQGSLPMLSSAGERPLETIYPNAKFSQGMMTNLHLASAYDFLQCIVEGRPSALSFHSALAVQEVLEAAYASAARGGERLPLPLGE
ncbi:MAG TPA: Gfo/Idh/MocA family oxidoreductase [Anaerolineales bacterium]|nr:Gfo/Idh/MocA family oxidoreductase [Anaerolineales bacterium]